jgi:hypothetical protein
MYITDATHFLDAKGAIGPKRGPGRKMAEFLGSVIVAATLTGTGTTVPKCIKCSAPIAAAIYAADVIARQCDSCREAGRISNWRHTLWDMTMNANNKPY